MKDTTILYDKTKPAMIPVRLMSNEKIYRETSWRPKISLKRGLELTYKWYKEQYKQCTPEDK